MASAQKLDSVSTKHQRIAKLAKQYPERAFTSLGHYIDIEWLREAYQRTRKDAAVGVDGQTAEFYAANLEQNLQSLLNRAKSGRYKAPPVRRVHIPKGPDGTETRPIGIPTLEDKILQRAVVMVLEPLYEQDFLDCSYGFRRGRSAHEALDALWNQTMAMGGAWILEVDIQQFFERLDHADLRELLRQRVRDGVLQGLIGKWLHAGVFEGGVVWHPEAGTPQGGVVTPPTILQKPLVGGFSKRGWIYPVNDPNIILAYLHLLDQRPYDLTTVRPVSSPQVVAYPLGKLFDTADHQLQFFPLGFFVGLGLGLGLQFGQAALGLTYPRLKFALVYQAIFVRIDDSTDAAFDFVDQGPQLFYAVPPYTFFPGCQSPSVFAFDTLRFCQQRADVLPDRLFQQIRTDLLVVTDPLAAKTVSVRAHATVVCIITSFAFAGAKTDRLAVIGVSTALTNHEALQQVSCTPAALAVTLFVLG
jgi:hypothetical protein